jgi:hypothetical protein
MSEFELSEDDFKLFIIHHSRIAAVNDLLKGNVTQYAFSAAVFYRMVQESSLLDFIQRMIDKYDMIDTDSVIIDVRTKVIQFFE